MKKPYFITNNFGEDSSREFIVQWHNDTSVTEQILQIAEDVHSMDSCDFSFAEEIKASMRAFSAQGSIGNYPARNIFRVHVKNLTPNTMYKYRMGRQGAWSETFYHTTSCDVKTTAAINRNFSFTVTADSQAGVFDTMKETLLMADNYDKDNRFFLNAGDLVEQIGLNPQEIVNYTEAANIINIKKPIAATQGNHDNYDTSGSYNFIYDEATIFNAFTVFPYNGWNKKNINKCQSYYFTYNDVLFVMLNTMINVEDQHGVQADWLKEVLRKSPAKYKIVCMHTGLFGNHYYEDYYVTEFRKAYGRIFTENKVDIVFSGHDHTYARTNPVKIGEDTSLDAINLKGDDEGTIYSIIGTSGEKYYDESEKAERADEIFAVRTRKIHDIQPGMFANVKVSENHLSVTAYRKDGKILDSYVIPAKR